ncbi:MAG: 2-keto-4-pentenoate hydratase/2-oxohepta-3-ene-1,7-dioic acid hydratase in catechol pathway [Candidatus Promineifilaceae bacterium]|jgi:2-keto-4-pentenoate hydratase/2-oxohepta-3-ene-1,7-dioic acid hydratase in catechol pathway
MKIASFKHNNSVSYGVVQDEKIAIPSDGFLQAHLTLRDVLSADALQQLAADCAQSNQTIALSDVQLLPPITNPQRMICVGINYPKRYPIQNENGENEVMPPPENAILFGKLDGTLVGHGQPLEIPVGPAAETFDYEGEITLVIGKGGRHIPAERAFEHIAGYTIMNDGSVRGWQKHSLHAGKNFANSGSCGPWMVTADEIDAPFGIVLQTRLNGELVQDTTAAEMVFAIPELIAYISHTIDLRPGDLIATGSPEGSGGSRTPQRFLRAGDELEIEVSGVGVLKNKVGR